MTIGCRVITVTPDLISKLELIGKGLDGYTLETVRTFSADAQKTGYVVSGHALVDFAPR